MADSIDYSRFEKHYPPKKKNSLAILMGFLLILILLILTAWTLLKSKKNVVDMVSPITIDIIKSGNAILNPDKNSKNIEKIVQKELSETKGDYSVVIKNLKTGESYYFNQHKIFDSASLYKLFVMGTVFQKIQGGNLDKTDVLSQQITILNDKFKISSDSAELTEGAITLPVQGALTRMITISDNYSALLLTEKVRLSQVALFLNQNSLTDSHVGTNGESPTTSAFDTGSFFEKLYNEDLASKSLTQDMLALLKNQTLNTKIPKYLPKNTIIAHKTGELDYLSHDAGIVYTPKGDYVIVVMSETRSPVIANEKIAKISKGIYEYFTY